jgi:hypothetical protein
MAEFERSRLINVAPGDVFAFVSDVDNLPTFIPTVQAIEPQLDDRVRIRGAIDGRSYIDDGWLHIDRDRRRLEWGDDEHTYSGSLTIAGDNGGTQVVVHLSLPPYFKPSGRPITGEAGNAPDLVEQSLEDALDSLRNLMEGRGGKVEPSALV